MAETLANGTVIPQGSDLIHSSGVQAMRNLGGSVDAQLANRSLVGHTHTWAQIASKPTTFAPAAHTHVVADVTGLAAMVYDSGWRDVSANLLGGTAGVLHIRRVGLQVYWRIKDYVAGTSHSFYEPPIGFRATADAHTYPAGQGQVGTSFYRHMNGRLTRSIYDPVVVSGAWFEGSYALPPGTAIPATLPGSNT